jgi:hypothetical protein
MAQDTKPDFRNGVALGDVPDGGMLLGQAGGQDVILPSPGPQPTPAPRDGRLRSEAAMEASAGR